MQDKGFQTSWVKIYEHVGVYGEAVFSFVRSRRPAFQPGCVTLHPSSLCPLGRQHWVPPAFLTGCVAGGVFPGVAKGQRLFTCCSDPPTHTRWMNARRCVPVCVCVCASSLLKCLFTSCVHRVLRRVFDHRSAYPHSARAPRLVHKWKYVSTPLAFLLAL